MNYTQNYHLGLPIPAERYDVSIVNANNTVIDGQLKTNADAITNHKNDHNNPHGVTAAQVGLGNVNNTADSAKPVSTPQSQYIASAVATEATRATNAEGALSDRITTAAGEISAEVTRATGVESTLSTQITNEVTRAQGAESGLRDYVDEKLSVTYKASGSVFFADLPALAASREGHVYNIKDAFTTTVDFVEGAGKDYPAGTNVAIIEKDEESYETATVEEGDNPSEMGLYELSGTDYVPTEDTAPVEGKTYYELVATPAYYYDVLSGFIDTSAFITDTDYATTQAAGIVKPDGTTITVDANGVISSQGGGDVSSEEVSDIVNILGSKNLNSYPYYDGTSKSYKGITYTIDRNTGIITVNGTSTDSSYFTCHHDSTYCELLLPNGQYILSGCPSQSGEPKYGIGMWVKKNGEYVNIAEDIGEGATFVIDGDDTYTDKARVVIQIFVVESGVNIDHMLFKPMIRPSHIEDDTFVPYTQTNNELTSNMFALKSKNILSITAKSQTINGVSFTVDDDGIITANGTASDDIAFYVGMFGIDSNDHEYYRFTTGCPEGSLSTYWIRHVSYNGSGNFTKATSFRNIYDSLVYICINSGYTCNNLVFKLKIRKNTDWSDEYVPSAKSNRELTSEQAFIANNYGVKNLLKNSAVGQTVNGVTFTIDDDGVVSCSGTSTDNIEFEIISEPLSFNYDVFICYGAVLGGTGYSHISIEYDEQGETKYRNILNGVDCVCRIPANSVITRIYICINWGYTMNNDIHKLMICSCSTTDFTYVPYAKTNRQLTMQLNTSGSEGESFNFDSHNGQYGWNEDENRDLATFHPFGADDNFVGTMQEWEDEENKSKYKTVDITDDVDGFMVDTTPTQGSQNIITSGGTYNALSTKANKSDLVNINIAGATNTTGAMIYTNTYFYLNGNPVRAKADIANGATFTLNTNYEELPDGLINDVFNKTYALSSSGTISGSYGFTIRWSKLGRIVQLQFENDTTNIPTAQSEIAILPSYLIPVQATYCLTYRYNQTKCTFSISETSGRFAVYNDSGSSQYYVAGSTTYIAKN